MKTKLLLTKKFSFGLVSVLLAICSISGALLMPQSANALNPLQVLVKQKCPRGADAAEKCGNDFSKKLKNKCGEPAGTDKYKNCARTFAKNNGATLAGNNCWSKCDPDEVNNGDDGENNGGGTTESGSASCGGVETSILSCENPSGASNEEGGAIWGILLLVINIMTAGVAIVAIGGFVYGAILYTSAQDNAGQVSKAKQTIFNVVVGIMLYAFMYAFLQFIVPGGIFK